VHVIVRVLPYPVSRQVLVLVIRPLVLQVIVLELLVLLDVHEYVDDRDDDGV